MLNTVAAIARVVAPSSDVEPLGDENVSSALMTFAVMKTATRAAGSMKIDAWKVAVPPSRLIIGLPLIFRNSQPRPYPSSGAARCLADMSVGESTEAFA